MRAFVNDTNIGYDDHGIGQPLLFLHAFPLNKSMWSGEMTTLLQEERQFRLVALDWRGFGESDITTGISTMEQFADDVEGLIGPGTRVIDLPGRMIDGATPQGIAAASRGMALRPNSTDLLANIHCPTLVIAGEHDVLTPPSVAQDYAAKIPGAQYIVIPSAGHLSNLEQPESFHQAISGFLYSVSW